MVLEQDRSSFMPVAHGIAAFVLQDADLTRHDIHLAMWFLGVIAMALVGQAICLGITSVFAAKLLHRVNGIANIVEQKTAPILDQTSQVLAELTPKIQSFTENAEQISYTVRAKVDELGATITQLNETVQEINGRSRTQIARVDGIVTDALVATEEIGTSVRESIKTPVRQIAGLVAGVKAGIETLIARSPFGRSGDFD
jgi:methyl-accepting chemotaxis protein